MTNETEHFQSTEAGLENVFDEGTLLVLDLSANFDCMHVAGRQVQYDGIAFFDNCLGMGETHFSAGIGGTERTKNRILLYRSETSGAAHM